MGLGLHSRGGEDEHAMRPRAHACRRQQGGLADARLAAHHERRAALVDAADHLSKNACLALVPDDWLHARFPSPSPQHRHGRHSWADVCDAVHNVPDPVRGIVSHECVATGELPLWQGGQRARERWEHCVTLC